MTRTSLISVIAGITLLSGVACGGEPVRVDSVHVRLIEQVEVPAQSEGVLSRIAVKEGQFVAADEILVQLDDTDIRLSHERAALDLEIAGRLAESELKVLLARNAVGEAREAKQGVEFELEIARRKSENDKPVHYARRAVEVAEAELQRAIQSRKTFRDSVSGSEIDTLGLARDKATLEAEQAVHDLAIAKLTMQMKQSEVASRTLAIDKREIEQKQAEEDRQIAELARKLKENDLASMRRDLERRTLKAPLPGVVVQIHKRRGEWVKPEDKVLRILRLDRLRAEGFVAFRDLRHNLEGAEAVLKVSLPDKTEAEFRGKVVFVSPEIDAVNGQVRVWADLENPKYVLRPGMKAALTIRVDEGSATK